MEAKKRMPEEYTGGRAIPADPDARPAREMDPFHPARRRRKIIGRILCVDAKLDNVPLRINLLLLEG